MKLSLFFMSTGEEITIILNPINFIPQLSILPNCIVWSFWLCPEKFYVMLIWQQIIPKVFKF
jgi:hypothetical protein